MGPPVFRLLRSSPMWTPETTDLVRREPMDRCGAGVWPLVQVRSARSPCKRGPSPMSPTWRWDTRQPAQRRVVVRSGAGGATSKANSVPDQFPTRQTLCRWESPMSGRSRWAMRTLARSRRPEPSGVGGTTALGSSATADGSASPSWRARSPMTSPRNSVRTRIDRPRASSRCRG